MAGFPSPFGDADDGDLFDEYDEFVPGHVPTPGPFLDGHRILTDEEHVDFHSVTRDLFEERTVYDMTFDYNLARLNLDSRHGSAGYRYAEEAADPAVLRAEFTPTTKFCPQTNTLTVGSFRAWNGLSERHGYDLIRVRAAPMHQNSESINERLTELEQEYRSTGEVGHVADEGMQSPGVARGPETDPTGGDGPRPAERPTAPTPVPEAE